MEGGEKKKLPTDTIYLTANEFVAIMRPDMIRIELIALAKFLIAFFILMTICS
jgi:hypothetical protein